MPDRGSACILIGGKIEKSLVNALIEIINSEKITADYGNCIVVIDDENDLMKYVNDKGYLQFADEELLNGVFDGIEHFLFATGIPFNRKSESIAEYPAETVWYRRGMKETDGIITDNSGNQIFRLTEIQIARRILAMGDDEPENHSKDELNDTVKKALEYFDRLIKEIPELPPFEIEGS